MSRRDPEATGDGRYLDLWLNRTNAAPPMMGEVGDWWGPVGRLGPGESRAITSPPQIIHMAGTNRLCAWIEFEHLISESSLTNNHQCLDFAVMSGNAEIDFDGDADSDIAVFHPAAGNWYIQYSTQSNAPLAEQFGWDAVKPVPGDYDGDGLADLAVYYPKEGMWYIRQSSDGRRRDAQWGWSGAAPVPGDYDGDGKTDLAVFHQAAGNWYVQYSRLNNAPRSQQFGWWEVVPTPADFDGDGKTDLAVYSLRRGMWYILQSSSGVRRDVQWGWSATVPVPGDYDGDGKADIAVFHRTTGNWYIQYSTRNNDPEAEQFGWWAVKPVAADYDGDGKTDIAVYYPGTGRWYIRESTTEQMRQVQWGWKDALPTLLAPVLHDWYNLP